MMSIIIVLTLIFAAFGIYNFILRIHDRVILKERTGTPDIMRATLLTHSYRGDKLVVEDIIHSYHKVEEFYKYLESSSKVDFNTNKKKLDRLMKKHISVVRRFRNSSALTKDRDEARSNLGRLEEEFQSLKTPIESKLQVEVLKNQSSEKEKNRIQSILEVHKENLRKCDLIRVYNHKAVPLKELSISMVGMIENLSVREGTESEIEAIGEQIKELSEVVDRALEQIPTYDSKTFVRNKICINQNLLKELENANYEDVLNIKTK